MDWLEPIDAYCERTDASFWSEPINAISNGAFLIAALIIFFMLRKQSVRDRPVEFFANLVAIIGLGSFLFHTLANGWSMVADVLPITVFIYGFFFFAARRFLRFGMIGASLSTVGFFAASFLIVEALDPILGGSAGYAPGLVTIFGFALILRNRKPIVSKRLFIAGYVFAVSLALRTLDPLVCDAFPLGTHFFWHCLNAITLALLLSAAMLDFRPRGQAYSA